MDDAAFQNSKFYTPDGVTAQLLKIKKNHGKIAFPTSSPFITGEFSNEAYRKSFWNAVGRKIKMGILLLKSGRNSSRNCKRINID